MEPNLKLYDLTSPQTNRLTSRALTAIKKKDRTIYYPIIYSHISSKVRFSGTSLLKYIIKTKTMTETDIQIDRHRQIDVSDR